MYSERDIERERLEQIRNFRMSSVELSCICFTKTLCVQISLMEFCLANKQNIVPFLVAWLKRIPSTIYIYVHPSALENYTIAHNNTLLNHF